MRLLPHGSMSENQSFSSHGFTVLYRFSPTSTVVKPSAAALEQLVAAGLAELSDQPDGKLDDIRVTRDGYKAEFLPLQLPTCQVTVLTNRQGPITRKVRAEGKHFGKFDDYGGYFERANFVGIFLVKVGSVCHEGSATPSGLALGSERSRGDVSISFTPTAGDGALHREKQPKASPTADRKKQLYRSLFDEDEEVDPATDSSSKENAKMSRKKIADGKVTSQKSAREERPRNKSKQTLTVREDSDQRSDVPVEPYSPSSHNHLNGSDDIIGPSYKPTVVNKKSSKSIEYVPEYIPGSAEGKGSVGNNAVEEYIPTKLSKISASIGRIPKISAYVPQPTKSKSVDSQSCPSYKPTVRRVAAVLSRETSPDEYEPTMPPGQHHPAYRPSAKRPNGRIDYSELNGGCSSVYEPTGGESDVTPLEYHPSRISKLVRKADDRVKLRPRKSHSSPSPPPKPRIDSPLERIELKETVSRSRQQQFHPRQRIGGVPEKCLMPEECFDWCSGMLQDRFVPQLLDGSYVVSTEQDKFDAQIRAAGNVHNLRDDHIRFVFYRLEDHLLAIPQGFPNDFHKLFMADRRDVLRFTLPIKEFKQGQQVLVRNLLSDNYSNRRGFDIQYAILVLMPEVLIHLHMAVHGRSYSESWKALDPGVYNWEYVLKLIEAQNTAP